MNSFQAFTLREQDTSVIGQLETITLDDLSEGTVVIKAAYSSVNFKDSLASKDGGVIRNYPMIQELMSVALLSHRKILVSKRR